MTFPLLLPLLFACLTSPLLAQVGPITDGSPGQAVIELEPEVILGGPGAVPGPPAATLVDNGGRRWMAFVGTGDIRIFDDQGVLRSIEGEAGVAVELDVAGMGGAGRRVRHDPKINRKSVVCNVSPKSQR